MNTRGDYSSDAARDIPSAVELVSQATELATNLRARAAQAERERNIPMETVEEYLETGLIHTIQPRRWGGYELDHEVAFDIAIELGKSTCGSSAWCLNYLSDHAGMLGHFPEEAQHDVWSRDSKDQPEMAGGRGDIRWKDNPVN